MSWVNRSSAHLKCRVFVDFDGTIAVEDTTDLLLERFALAEWQAIEADWTAGRIGSRECMVRQIDLVRATPEAMDAFIGAIEIDPAFPRFVEVCRRLGHELTVVSDGLDRTVGAVLQRNGLDLAFRANRLAWTGGDRWRLSFPHARSDCAALAGNCKCQFAEAARYSARIVVGDGRSDFCIAERADLVLSKGALTRHCAENALPHVAFNGFDHAIGILEGWLAAKGGERRAEADASRRPINGNG